MYIYICVWVGDAPDVLEPVLVVGPEVSIRGPVLRERAHQNVTFYEMAAKSPGIT